MTVWKYLMFAKQAENLTLCSNMKFINVLVNIDIIFSTKNFNSDLIPFLTLYLGSGTIIHSSLPADILSSDGNDVTT